MIKNKFESDYLIKMLDLNRMLEGRFTDKTPINEVKRFLNTCNCNYYNIREKSLSAGKFKYKLTRSEVIDIVKEYNNYAIYESLAEADNKLILQGDIEIDKDFILRASLSDIKGISNRLAMQKPIYSLYNYDLKEEREPSINGLTQVIDYISSHSLIGMVVEFSLYDVPVGIYKENIIIWELRNY